MLQRMFWTFQQADFIFWFVLGTEEDIDGYRKVNGKNILQTLFQAGPLSLHKSIEFALSSE